MVDMTDESSAGPSAWYRGLYTHLTSHVQAERDLLDHYQLVAEQTQSNAFRYLVNLLVEEEIRHHQFFTELADSLKTQALLTGEDPTIPYMDFDQADRAAVLDATKQLMANEQEDYKELKQLQHELRDVKDNSLWALVVDLMQRDTQKHISILRFVQKHTRSARK